MTLSAEDKDRIRSEVERMIAEYRLRPTQELEDRLGLEVAVMPEQEREHVPAVLLEIVAGDAAGRH